MKRLLFSFILLSLSAAGLGAQTLHVGAGQPYATLTAAAADAQPGDTILIHGGMYPGGIYIENLQGTADAWIHIRAVEGDTVIFQGGTNAWQLTDAAYLHIHGIIFQGQSGNGVNFDDGGTYDSPAHHILFESCVFRDMAASGNNDLLKLSGVDSFEIRHCLFLNGAAGGSGIDMVGCHDGAIRNSVFEDLGSNAIQAKGGSRNIRIQANTFRNGGARAVNLGGSTGLAFFRPIDAPYEAADLKVYSNIFMGSQAPIAFVGATGTEVVNNTIFLPGKWVLRILQESVDPGRFEPCGQNTFRNNIVYLDDQVSVTCNIGPNTAPETFTFSHNLWYHATDPNWPGPVLPVPENGQITGHDPLFESPTWEWSNFVLRPGSPAIGMGYPVADPEQDYLGFSFLPDRSVGAIDIRWNDRLGQALTVSLYSAQGTEVWRWHPAAEDANQAITFRWTGLPSGWYVLQLVGSQGQAACPIHVN